MPTSIAHVTTTRADGGWLNTCTCGHLQWHPRRPSADRAARDHQITHTPKEHR